MTDENEQIKNNKQNKQGHGWKLNRTSYYQEGWLAAGNVKSVVGVTFTSTLPHRTAPMTAAGSSKAQSDLSDFTLPPHLPLPPRTNYNLRGHRAQVNNSSLSFIFFFRLTRFFSGSMFIDQFGKMERAVSEVGHLRRIGNHLRLDPLRGSMVD